MFYVIYEYLHLLLDLKRERKANKVCFHIRTTYFCINEKIKKKIIKMQRCLTYYGLDFPVLL